MSRVVVTLSLDEREALVKLALNQLRSPRDQARFILVTELRRMGLLSRDSIAQQESTEREPKLSDKPHKGTR